MHAVKKFTQEHCLNNHPFTIIEGLKKKKKADEARGGGRGVGKGGQQVNNSSLMLHLLSDDASCFIDYNMCGWPLTTIHTNTQTKLLPAHMEQKTPYLNHTLRPRDSERRTSCVYKKRILEEATADYSAFHHRPQKKQERKRGITVKSRHSGKICG